MIDILIVDDDFLSRAQLKSVLDFEAHGYRIVAEAKNGEEAIRIIESSPPDLVVTDINMPNVNGIMLLEHLRRHYPDIAVIALSAYDDFAYVRDVLKLGARDYLLKHSLEKEQLLQVLDEAAGNRKSRRDIPREGAPARQAFVRSVLLSPPQEADTLLRAQSCPQELHSDYLVVSVYFEAPRNAPPGTKRREPGFLLEAIEGIARDTLAAHKNADCVRLDTELLLLFYFGAQVSRRGIPQQVEQHLNRLRRNVRLFLDVALYFGVSELHAQPQRLPTARGEAEDRLCLHFFYPEAGIYRSSLPRDHRQLPLPAAVIRELKACLTSANVAAYLTELRGLFADIKSRHARYGRIQSFCYQLLKELEELAADLNIPLEQWDHGDAPPFSKRESETDIVKIEAWFGRLGETVAQGVLFHKADQHYSKVTQDALRYIKEHYPQGISLKEAAEHISFNASYLSRVFKEETGQTFVHYLNEYRINRAIERMRELEGREATLGEIAKGVGFNSYNHFISVFRSVTGYLPEAYLTRLQQE